MRDPIKRRSRATLRNPQHRMLPDELGEYVAREATLVERLVWEKITGKECGQGELTKL